MHASMSPPGPRWPTGTDYARAIQSAHVAFADATLRGATVATNMMGMPLVASGQNAVVFLLRSGGQDHAVRCFTTPPADGSHRYTALAAHLSASGSTAMTSSRWLDEGIQVDHQRWPVVVMPWVEGRPLNLVVEDIVGDSARLVAMADSWAAMVTELQEADVTHGDLQHGNVLVRPDGTFCLVDLDGSWVPTMQVGPPLESGHPNYQHPRRSSGQWGRYGDSYSALVIETGLRALAADPTLGRFLSGENLVFSRSDLLDTSSGVWPAVLASSEAEVRRLSTILRQRAQDPPGASMLPYSQLRAGSVAPASLPNDETFDMTVRRDSLPQLGGSNQDWWHSAAAPAASALTSPAPGPASGVASRPSATIGAPPPTPTSAPSPAPAAAASTPDPVAGRASLGALLGRDVVISGAIGGAIAAASGSIIAGLLAKVVSDMAVSAVFVLMVAVMLSAVLLSWQAFAARAYGAGARRLAAGALLGAAAGALSLAPANAIYGSATTQVGTTTVGLDTFRMYEFSSGLSAAVWAVVAALVGLSVGATRGVRAAIAAAVGGAVAGLAGGWVFGETVAEFRGHLLLVDGLGLSTIVLVAGIGLAIGAAIGAAGKSFARARLVIIEGRSQGMETLLPAKRATIGAASGNTLVLVGDPSVAAHHVEIDLRSAPPAFTVTKGSMPIRVNGVSQTTSTLVDGDVLTIGGSFVRFEWKGTAS